MGEYSSEQRKQVSRAIGNSDTGSKQLKGLVDNRIIQQKKNAEEAYVRMQSKHGGGKLHSKRTTVPKERIKKQRESSIDDLFMEYRTAEEQRTNTTLSEARLVQLKSKLA